MFRNRQYQRCKDAPERTIVCVDHLLGLYVWSDGSETPMCTDLRYALGSICWDLGKRFNVQKNAHENCTCTTLPDRSYDECKRAFDDEQEGLSLGFTETEWAIISFATSRGLLDENAHSRAFEYQEIYAALPNICCSPSHECQCTDMANCGGAWCEGAPKASAE